MLDTDTAVTIGGLLRLPVDPSSPAVTCCRRSIRTCDLHLMCMYVCVCVSPSHAFSPVIRGQWKAWPLSILVQYVYSNTLRLLTFVLTSGGRLRVQLHACSPSIADNRYSVRLINDHSSRKSRTVCITLLGIFSVLRIGFIGTIPRNFYFNHFK